MQKPEEESEKKQDVEWKRLEKWKFGRANYP